MRHLHLCYTLLVLPQLPPAALAGVGAADQQRILYVDYHPDRVIEVAVQRGTATRIVLAPDEHILRDGAATGFAADCSKTELEWCMRADPGSSQLLVRPKSGAQANNLELRTDQRDYSFRFVVLPDAGSKRNGAVPTAATQPAYRLILRYPEPQAGAKPAAGVNAEADAASLIRSARPQPRNWQYSMQVLPGADDIVPSLVFDDGRFTYLQFPANREMPTVYYLAATGEEARVNFHIDPHDPGMLVAERMARRLVLRLGPAVVGLWNEAYDSYGLAPSGGTTVDGVVRTIQQGTP